MQGRQRDELNTVAVITGKEDVVTDGERTIVIRNGHPILTKVTGTGCLLTSVIGAFVAVEKDYVKAKSSRINVLWCSFGTGKC